MYLGLSWEGELKTARGADCAPRSTWSNAPGDEFTGKTRCQMTSERVDRCRNMASISSHVTWKL